LKAHADPKFFRRLYIDHQDVRIAEHQIMALATQSSKACELTRELYFYFEQSWYSACCDDLIGYLPSAVSALKNLTCFRLVTIIFLSLLSDGERLPNIISSLFMAGESTWPADEVLQAVARLPQLTELNVTALGVGYAHFPYGLFANLSILTVQCRSGRNESSSFFISQLATAIANSPQLKRLDVIRESHYGILPTLSHLFAKLSDKNPLRLERLYLMAIDATVDKVVLPHLTYLTSFQSILHLLRDIPIVQSIWTSLLVNNVKLSEVTISGTVTDETMLFLSSFSGLKRLAVQSTTRGNFENMFFAEVLPKHVSSLQSLEISNWVKILSFLCATSSLTRCIT
jgi:hypothetical protein